VNWRLRLVLFVLMVPTTIFFILGALLLHGSDQLLGGVFALLCLVILALDMRRLYRSFCAR